MWSGATLQRPTYRLSSGLFLRLLGLVYFFAFLSLGLQIDGLIGEHGILPIGEHLAQLEAYNESLAEPGWLPWRYPTLAWVSSADGFLTGIAVTGAVLSLLLVGGLLPVPILVALWILYLSLLVAGQTFLSFQWDILLLEAGFLAVWMAPLALRSSLASAREPPRLALWLVWWLLFRLMLESGAVKLTWDNLYPPEALGPNGNTWEDLTALTYHYTTQPLVLWTSWFAAKLPIWFQKCSVVAVILIEIGLPFFLFGPRLLRRIAFAGFAFLMLVIGATGNYNFFNLLTIALALTLLDDDAWPQVLRARLPRADGPQPSFRGHLDKARRMLLLPFALLVVLISAPQVRNAVWPRGFEQRSPRLESRLGIRQFHLVNSYGLFRHMTETRPEIVIEGSVDGVAWKAYDFRWKPGEPAARPRFTGPHQPRLDWQMWFEALHMEQVHRQLGTVPLSTSSPWFRRFVERLAEAEPSVLALLDDDPFSGEPPRHLRIALYQYRFTTAEEKRKTAHWWHRELVWRGRV